MKLANHIAIRYIGFTIVILLCFIPLTYFVLRAVMNGNMDESMRFQRRHIEESLRTVPSGSFISPDNDISVRQGDGTLTSNRFFTVNQYVADDNEIVPYRVMEFGTIVNGRSYFVRIRRSMVENDDILRAIAGIQLLILILLFSSLLAINKNLNKKIWNPFYKTLESLRKFRIDKDKPLNLPEVPITELDNLNKSLNALTGHNKEIFQAQKEFTENASHELQTPLALMRSDLDMLWQTSPITEEQAKLLQNLTETNSRMSGLNKSLLFLAKIDNNQFPGTEEIELDNIIENILERLEPAFAQRDIQIVKNISSGIREKANKTLIETLFSNLITNALRYTPQNGTVNIVLSATSFEISNSGDGKALDKEKLFKRFMKQSNSGKSGNGLGLEICKRICDLNVYGIRYDFTDSMHRFTIDF